VNAARITDYITSNLIFALTVFLPSRLTSSERQLKQRSDDIWAIQSSLALKLKSASTNSCTRLGKIRFPARGAFDFAAEQRKLHCKVVIQ
jgi:hypothetical protein